MYFDLLFTVKDLEVVPERRLNLLISPKSHQLPYYHKIFLNFPVGFLLNSLLYI